MALTRHQKFRPVLIAGVTAVIVGGTGAAFACSPWDSEGSAANASPISDTTQIEADASSDAATPTSGATSPDAAQMRKNRKHNKGNGTTSPTTSTTDPDDTSTEPEDTATTDPSTDDSPTSEPTESSSPAETSTSDDDSTDDSSSDDSSTDDSELAQFQAEVLALTNEEREAAGCGDLTANDELEQAAQDHAEDMLANNYFDHESQDGTTPFERMTAAGYNWSTAAENIAAGQATPEAVMTSWMNSAGHKANILNCDLTELGVGYAAGSGADYGTYWVQDFGTPAS